MSSLLPTSVAGTISLARVFWLPLVLVALALWLLNEKHQKHLSKIPGPAAAGYTKLWRFYGVYRGGFTSEQIKLHQRLRPIVRVGPKFISISDPETIPIIYPLKQTLTKTNFYPIQSVFWTKQIEMNVFSTTDLAKHRKDKQRKYEVVSMPSSTMMAVQALIGLCTAMDPTAGFLGRHRSLR